MIEKDQNQSNDLWQYVEKNAAQIERALLEFAPLAPPAIETKFNEAVRYALFSGGKRLRPILTLLGAKIVGANADAILPSAVAVEFIHTSSLVFDDLPSMDNAGERRGKTSLHAQFGEGLAILVAIGFLNSAYGLVFVGQENQLKRAVAAHREICECVGASGMLGGQSVDLALAKSAGENNFSNESYEFESIKNLKTSALMCLALRVGAILAGAKDDELAHLSRFANFLGDAYQLSDDLIDLEEDAEIFSETKTFAINQGKTDSRIQLNKLIEQSKSVLTDNFADSEARRCLVQFTNYLAERKV